MIVTKGKILQNATIVEKLVITVPTVDKINPQRLKIQLGKNVFGARKLVMT